MQCFSGVCIQNNLVRDLITDCPGDQSEDEQQIQSKLQMIAAVKQPLSCFLLKLFIIKFIYTLASKMQNVCVETSRGYLLWLKGQ